MSFVKDINDVAKQLKKELNGSFSSQVNKDKAERDAIAWFRQSIGTIMGSSNNKGEIRRIVDDVFKADDFSSYKGKQKSELLKLKRQALSSLDKKKIELTKQTRQESNLDFILRQGNITNPFTVDVEDEKERLGLKREREKGEKRDKNSTDNMGIVRLAKTYADIGGMYMYYYDAKTKAKLPYWDTFPLILMVDSAPKGFYGINLHYVPPEIRAEIIKQILENARIYNSDSVLYQMNYDFLSKLSTTAWRPCFKRYLYSHVQTQMYEVPIENWSKAVMLPNQAFAEFDNGRTKPVGASRVWTDSMRKM